MSVAFTEVRKIPTLRSIRLIGTLTFSGSYVVGGEVPTGIVKPGTTKDPYDARVQGRGDHTYRYDKATGKVKVFVPAGTEHTAVAYAAGVTGDDVRIELEYPKGG